MKKLKSRVDNINLFLINYIIILYCKIEYWFLMMLINTYIVVNFLKERFKISVIN